MNTFQLECFLAVAEHLNFAQAAQQLHVTHPAVSQQIKSLEKELNVQLFRRTTRSVRLTEEGKAFLNDAQQMVAIAERAKKRFDGSDPEPIETMALGCYDYPCIFLLFDTLARLRAQRPTLHPRLQVIPFQHIYRRLEEGDLDAIVGFRELPKGKTQAVYRELLQVPIVCICPTGHPLAQRDAVTPEDLQQERLVLFAPLLTTSPVAQLQGQLMGDRQADAFYFCESAEAISVLVTAGYGISVLPASAVPGTHLLARVPLQGDAPVSFGIYHRQSDANPVLKAFLRAARESFASNAAFSAEP